LRCYTTPVLASSSFLTRRLLSSFSTTTTNRTTTTMGLTDLEKLSINTIRAVSADQPQAASSGHPGAPMGCAPMAYVLWQRHLRHGPAEGEFFNRDRFVLSAGHGSSMLYALMHLYGYGLSLEDLKAFRQLGSKTPGHPESFMTHGVEATTGPLGQGVANAVGMAIAERALAQHFNRSDFSVIDHFTYAIASDGGKDPSIASLDVVAALEAPRPSRHWIVEDWVPKRRVTLLSGDGGSGKSLLAQQLAGVLITTDQPDTEHAADRRQDEKAEAQPQCHRHRCFPRPHVIVLLSAPLQHVHFLLSADHVLCPESDRFG